MAITDLALIKERIGVAVLPERWEAVFPEAAAELESTGCRAADPAYYDYLENRYGMMGECLGEYKALASAVRENDALLALLMLQVFAMRDREKFPAELGSFKLEAREPDLARDSFQALTCLSLTDRTYRLLKKRGIPEADVRRAIALPVGGLRVFRERHGGRNGFDLLGWFQLSVDGKLFPLGRLEFELYHFNRNAAVFTDGIGNYVNLATGLAVHRSGHALGSAGNLDPEGGFVAEISESDSAWEGHPFLEDGRVSRKTVRLEKTKWKVFLTGDSPAIGVHIPPGGGLTPEKAGEAIGRARDFFSRYFPDKPCKCFVCQSWMMDPVLCDLLGENANISSFNRRFKKMTCKYSGRDIFHFVFLLGNAKEIDFTSLDDSTTLKRRVKELYLSGGCIKELKGWFI